VTWVQALVLGTVQGLTEFLPVSSSAHLVLVPWLLGWDLEPEAAFVFDVLVQLGTLAAVVIYFWRDLVHMLRSTAAAVISRRRTGDAFLHLTWLVVLGTLPAVAAGLLLKPLVEAAFASPAAVSLFLLVTAGLLLAAERAGRRSAPLESATGGDAVWVGLAQALSIFPGISRSGSTIAAGLARGLQRPAAARFSFLLSIPVMIGAGLVAGLDLAALPGAATYAPTVLVGFVAAAIVGYLSIRWLLSFVGRHSLAIFGIYCLAAGLAGLLLAWLRG
jgi:undecaprenyl-diphosphatase